MSVFTPCEHCGVYLTPAHTIQTMQVPNVKDLVAIMLKCTVCRGITKVVEEKGKWKEVQDAYEQERANLQSVLDEAVGEILDLDSVAQLQEIWSKHPPLREEVMGSCDCKSCRKRRYLYA